LLLSLLLCTADDAAADPDDTADADTAVDSPMVPEAKSLSSIPTRSFWWDDAAGHQNRCA